MPLVVSIIKQFFKNITSHKLDIKKKNNVLVVSNGPSFGDLIHTIPVIQALSQHNDVSVLTTPGYEIPGYKYITEKEALDGIWGLTFVCDDKHKVRWNGNTVYSEAIRVVKRLLHTWHEYNWSDFFLDIAKEYDSRIDYKYTPLLVKTPEYIVIHPGASAQNKAWNFENYMILYKNIKNAGYEPIILITKNDGFILDKTIEYNCSVVYANNTEDLTKIAEKTKMFIGNDSGIMHFFGLYDCDIVGIFTYGCADSHYPWTPRGFVYYEPAVFEKFYKEGIVEKIHLTPEVLSEEVLSILKTGKLTEKRKEFFTTKEKMKYV